MYAKFFGLQQEPFSIAPDPRYLFMSERHREALAHLLYGLQGGGGFVLLTGEIGAGKTTVCRCFLEQIPANCNVAYIFNPKLTVTELLRTVCDEFHIEHSLATAGAETVKQYLDPLNAFLLRTHADGRNNVLIIDEAQNLDAEVLEQLRLLTNLETNERKLLQIILIGQPELRTMVAHPELEQLAQRVIARFHLQALSESETAQYVRHRLSVAGFTGAMPFDGAACRRIHQLSRGVPRRINLLCDRALLGAYALGRATVGRSILDKAAAEVFDKGEPLTLAAAGWGRGGRWIWAAGGAGLLVGAAAVAVAMGHGDAGKNTAPLAKNAASATSAADDAGTKIVATMAPSSVSAGPITVGQADEAGERAAWRDLAAAWQLTLPDFSESEACAALKTQAVQCFKSDGGLAQLRLLTRPAILTLRDDAGKASYVLLTGLNGQQATLRAGKREQTVSLQTLGRQWQGELVTLWRVPPGYQGKLTEGAMTDWLSAQLAKASGAAPAPPDQQASSPQDGPNLPARVAAFQRTQGLRSDGIAGPITLMELNRAAGVDEPRLTSN